VTGFSRRPRVQGEDGQTLVEMLIAMMFLTVGILALVAAYSSGYTALNRATRVSSATLVADAQMERFRALKYGAIQLNTSCGTTCTEDATFTGDSAYSSTAQVTGCSSTTESTCLPTQTKTGPDGKSYRLDTYIEYSCVSGTYVSATSCGSGNPYPVKRVTLVVRSSSLTAPVREQSDFTAFPGS
jgi:Tfp pilus assembly protein PilV